MSNPVDREIVVNSVASDEPITDWSAGSIIGDFEIMRQISTGGSARVFLARQRSLDRDVVLKFLRGPQNEAEILSRLDHPHIMPVLFEEGIGDQPVLVMPYRPGITLADLIEQLAQSDRSQPRFGELLAIVCRVAGVSRPKELDASAPNSSERFVRTVCHWMRSLALALEHAHSRGVIHRDVKPENILVTTSGRLILIDFSVAVTKPGGEGENETVAGGTLSYMSPEQMQQVIGDESVCLDGRTDVYALGLVFFELLTGRRAFAANEATGGILAAARAAYAERLRNRVDFESIPSHCPRAIRSVIERCLEPALENRYDSASELAEDLERFLDDRPLQFASEPVHLGRAMRFCRRHRHTTIVVLVMLATGLAMIGWDWRRAGRRLDRAEEILNSEADASSMAVAELADAERVIWGAQPIVGYPGLQTRQAELLHRIGLAHAQAERWDHAAASFRQTVEIRPEWSEAHLNLGVAYYQLGEYSKARNACDLAVLYGGDWAESYANRAAARARLGDFDGARADLRRASALNADSRSVKHNARLLEQLESDHDFNN